jgi:hypothetical protein
MLPPTTSPLLTPPRVLVSVQDLGAAPAPPKDDTSVFLWDKPWKQQVWVALVQAEWEGSVASLLGHYPWAVSLVLSFYRCMLLHTGSSG